MKTSINETPTCYNCIYCRSWDYPGTRKDPPDSGWERQTEDEPERIGELEEKYEELLESLAVIAIAAECPKYSYRSQEQDSEPDNEPLSESDLAELRAISEAEDIRHCTEMGWYNPETQKFTDEYYRASDRAYDSRR
jgi:hypothetical protein